MGRGLLEQLVHLSAERLCHVTCAASVHAYGWSPVGICSDSKLYWWRPRRVVSVDLLRLLQLS